MATKPRRPKFKINDRVTPASNMPRVPAYDDKPFLGRGTILRVSSISGTGSVRNPYELLHAQGAPPRQFVLSYLGYIKSYPEVYGSQSAQRMYKHHWRRSAKLDP